MRHNFFTLASAIFLTFTLTNQGTYAAPFTAAELKALCTQKNPDTLKCVYKESSNRITINKLSQFTSADLDRINKTTDLKVRLQINSANDPKLPFLKKINEVIAVQDSHSPTLIKSLLSNLKNPTLITKIKLVGFKSDAELSGLTRFTNLEKLTLVGPISDKSITTLQGFTNLRSLEIYSSNITESGQASLKQHFRQTLEELNIN